MRGKGRRKGLPDPPTGKDEMMSETTVVSERFTVTYKRNTGFEPLVDGFIGNDENSGGYPYFTDKPDPIYLRDNLTDAIRDAAMVERDMVTYFGHDEVVFTSVRVVRYRVVIETIDNILQASQEALVESATKKLSAEELAALISAQHPIGG